MGGLIVLTVSFVITGAFISGIEPISSTRRFSCAPSFVLELAAFSGRFLYSSLSLEDSIPH